MTDKVTFLEPENMGERIWGEEILLGLVSKHFTLKKLYLKKGCKGGLQYHHKKNELGYLLSGELIVRFDNGNGELTERIVKPGESFHFPPGAVHQEEAIEDCVIFEVSTPHFNDRVRVEKKYGIDCEEGLPSTNLEDVQER